MRRWYGLDIVRSIFLIAVIHFHSHEAFFLTPGQTFKASQSISPWLEFYSRSLAFGGQVLVLLFSFLAGYKHKSQRPLWLFLGAGILLLTVVEGRPFLETIYYEWDIYSYLLVCVLVVDLLGKSRWGNRVLLYGGALILLIPWWNYVKPFDSLLFEALVGSCPPEASGAWPLLPWAGLFFVGYAVGYFISTEQTWKNWVFRVGKNELVLWALLLPMTLPFLGAYYHVVLDARFYCYVLRKSDLQFLAHIAWVVAAMRFSLLPQVNEFLGRSRFVRWLSHLRWNSSFGLCYMTHFIFLGAGSLLREQFLEHPRLYDAYFIGLIIATEYLVRGIVQVRDLRRAAIEASHRSPPQ